jgi:hypothetical protein
MIRTVPASVLTKTTSHQMRGAVLGRLDAAGSLCRVLLPALTGLVCDRFGVGLAFAVQSAMSMAGLAVVEGWSRAAATHGLNTVDVSKGATTTSLGRKGVKGD